TELVTGLKFSFRGGRARLSAKIGWVDQPVASTSPLIATQPSPPIPSIVSGTQQSSVTEAPPSHGQFLEQQTFKRLSAENPQSTAVVNAIFVLARFYSAMGQLQQQLVDATKRKTLDRIIDVVRIVDDRVTNIVPLPEKGVSEIYVDIGEPSLVPLPLMGAGFFNVLNITAATLAVGNGIALIDEIEDGIHYLAFPSLARSLIQIVSQADAQLFITTHSGEIIDAFAEAA